MDIKEFAATVNPGALVTITLSVDFQTAVWLIQKAKSEGVKPEVLASNILLSSEER